MEGRAKSNRRLLILDDEEEIRTTLAQYFGSLGYRVDIAANVPEALEKLPEGFHVVLSDIRMPDADGMDFLQQARRINPKLGVFFITGYPTLETVIDAKQLGAVAYFRKPLNLAQVESRLRAFLGEEGESLIEGGVLVVTHGLMARLKDRLARFQTVVCPSDEDAFLAEVGQQHPKAVLAYAGAPETPQLLRAYQRLGRDANSFLLVSDDQTLDATNEMLFNHSVSGCIPLEASREVVERRIQDAVNLRETQKDEQ
jgi:CheY-like chemotaxis protein